MTNRRRPRTLSPPAPSPLSLGPSTPPAPSPFPRGLEVGASVSHHRNLPLRLPPAACPWSSELPPRVSPSATVLSPACTAKSLWRPRHRGQRHSSAAPLLLLCLPGAADPPPSLTPPTPACPHSIPRVWQKILKFEVPYIVAVVLLRASK